MPMYEFQCDRKHVTELLTVPTCTAIRCLREISKTETCGLFAKRILSPTPGVVKNPAVPKGSK